MLLWALMKPPLKRWRTFTSQTFKIMLLASTKYFSLCACAHGGPVLNMHLVHKNRATLGCWIPYSTTMLGVRTHLKTHIGEKSKNCNQCDNEQIHIGACRIPYSATMLGVRGPWPSLPKWEETKSKTICYQHHLQTPTVRGVNHSIQIWNNSP